MATPSCESDGLSLHNHGLAFLSNRVLPPWNWVGILAEVTIGATALISWVSGPMIPTTLLEASSWWTAGTESASSHCVSAWASLSCWPRMPPPSLIAFCATCEPWSMAWPRLAKVPVKQDSTPMVTGPLGSLLFVLEVEVSHAARANAAATEPARMRHRPACASALTLLLMNPPAQSPSWIGPRLVQPSHIVNGWTTGPLCLLDSAANGRATHRRASAARAQPPLRRCRRKARPVRARVGNGPRRSVSGRARPLAEPPGQPHVDPPGAGRAEGAGVRRRPPRRGRLPSAHARFWRILDQPGRAPAASARRARSA